MIAAPARQDEVISFGWFEILQSGGVIEGSSVERQPKVSRKGEVGERVVVTSFHGVVKANSNVNNTQVFP